VHPKMVTGGQCHHFSFSRAQTSVNTVTTSHGSVQFVYPTGHSIQYLYWFLGVRPVVRGFTCPRVHLSEVPVGLGSAAGQIFLVF